MRSRRSRLPSSARTSGFFASSTAGTQAKVGELMGWPSNSTVCAAEGRRNGRQRGFITQEVERLAAIFGVSPSQLTTRCANCGGHPPAGFACMTCGARLQHCPAGLGVRAPVPLPGSHRVWRQPSRATAGRRGQRRAEGRRAGLAFRSSRTMLSQLLPAPGPGPRRKDPPRRLLPHSIHTRTSVGMR